MSLKDEYWEFSARFKKGMEKPYPHQKPSSQSLKNPSPAFCRPLSFHGQFKTSAKN